MTAELQNWSVLATRAMNDALMTIETIDVEDTTEEDRLDELRSLLRVLVCQGHILNGAIPQSKLSQQKPRKKAKK